MEERPASTSPEAKTSAQTPESHRQKRPKYSKGTRDITQSPSRILADKSLIVNLTFAAPFLVVAATTLKNGVALSVSMAVVLVPTVIVSLVLRQKLGLPYWLGTPIWTIVAMFLTAASYFGIRFISVEITDSLGIYLYLLSSATVVSAVFTGKRITTLAVAGAWALRYTGGFALAALVISAIREVLAYGTLWSFALPEPLRLEGAKMPFFGFIMFGVFSAGYQWLRRTLTEFFRARAVPAHREGGGAEA